MSVIINFRSIKLTLLLISTRVISGPKIVRFRPKIFYLIVIEMLSAFHDSDDASLDLVIPVLVNLSFGLVALRLGLTLPGTGCLLHLDPVQL